MQIFRRLGAQPKRRVRHTIVVSDLHVHDDRQLAQINDLCKYVEDRKPSLLVLDGDIADPWQAKWAEIRQTRSWGRLCQLCAVRDKLDLDTVYVRGNHDNGARKTHLNDPKHLKITWKYEEGRFLFTHGWQWDSIWGGPIGQVLFWISRNLPCAMIPCYNVWSRLIRKKTPATLKSKGTQDEWTAKIEGIHHAAQTYAKKNHLTVVLGHTHYPRMNSLIADAGDWVDSFSLVEITKDGRVSLKHLVNGKMVEFAAEDRVDRKIPSVWPKRHTAFLIIHGSGPHRPFETIDSFARGFWDALETQDRDLKKKVTWSHQLRRHAGTPPWIESFISLSPKEGPTLDFYEYYWDCYMVRDVTPKEILKWLDKATDGAGEFYKHLPDKAKEYQHIGVDLFKNGEFDSWGYRMLLGRLSRIRVVILLLGRIMEPCVRWASKQIDDLMGDVVIYTTSDVRSANYETRQKMLNGAVEELGQLLANGRYDRIVVAGHSLGSVIAYDALNRIVLEINVPGQSFSETDERMAGLVTFGSPLDKIAFFFQDRTPVDNFVQRQILAHIHSFRKVQPSGGQETTFVGSPIKHKLEKLVWLNFFHLDDSASGSLDAYEVDKNIQCKVKAKGFSKAHNCYWTYDQMYLDIASHFF